MTLFVVANPLATTETFTEISLFYFSTMEDKVVCYECHQEGHKSIRCPLRKEKKSNIICHYCGEPGHIAPKCHKRKKSVSSRKVCRYYLHGNCNQGSDCSYAHPVLDNSTPYYHRNCQPTYYTDPNGYYPEYYENGYYPYYQNPGYYSHEMNPAAFAPYPAPLPLEDHGSIQTHPSGSIPDITNPDGTIPDGSIQSTGDESIESKPIADESTQATVDESMQSTVEESIPSTGDEFIQSNDEATENSSTVDEMEKEFKNVAVVGDAENVVHVGDSAMEGAKEDSDLGNGGVEKNVGSGDKNSSSVFVGLKNDVGDNSCFLNVVVQALANNELFQDRFHAHSHFCYDTLKCLYCALLHVFTLLHKRNSVVSTQKLRLLLSELFKEQAQFVMGAMDDAAEAHDLILCKLHQIVALDEKRCNLENKDSSCFVHESFGMYLAEIGQCASCESPVKPLRYDTFALYASVNELYSIQKQYPGCTFGELLKKSIQLSSQTCASSKCTRKEKTNTVSLALHLEEVPNVFTLGLTWPSERTKAKILSAVLSEISPTLNLQEYVFAINVYLLTK